MSSEEKCSWNPDTPGSVRSAPPVLGQHTDLVLQTDLGLSSSEIARLRETGVI